MSYFLVFDKLQSWVFLFVHEYSFLHGVSLTPNAKVFEHNRKVKMYAHMHSSWGKMLFL